jgi:hypothetical protein
MPQMRRKAYTSTIPDSEPDLSASPETSRKPPVSGVYRRKISPYGKAVNFSLQTKERQNDVLHNALHKYVNEQRNLRPRRKATRLRQL